MQFEVVSSVYDCENTDTIYLILDGWNDWFTYWTLYNAQYIDKNGTKHKMSGVKIGQKGQKESPNLPEKFSTLSDEFFSLGASEDYYNAMKRNFPEDHQREEIFRALHDIAYDLELFERVKQLDVVQTSLMRDYTESIVKNQLHRMTMGGAWLTSYQFGYFPDADKIKSMEDIWDHNITELEFEVEPEKMPPSNIHVLIGKNGVGKTTLLKDMINALEKNGKNRGRFETYGGKGFANIVYVSFSAFDGFLDIENEFIPYSYIGLTTKDGMKNIDMLARDFVASLFEISEGNKKKLWEQTIDILESDNTFIDLNIKKLSEERENNSKELLSKDDGAKSGAYRKSQLKESFIEKIMPRFQELSSGHKVILLIVARLIELVEEKTLVIMDEPEEHLHPPLVSALIRALSNLLTYRNGVGIVATHSPVIVQEVPKHCVWILRRAGEELIAERPEIETFGENLGILTSEIFGYEVTHSGFHAMIQNSLERHSSYKRALRYFHGQLGNEGKSILRSLMYEKEHSEEEKDD